MGRANLQFSISHLGFPIFLPLVLLCLILGGTHPAKAGDPAPYRKLSEAGAGFLGPGRNDPEPQGLRSVRIGLIGPVGRPEGMRLREGVALAIAEANARGGYRNLPYELVFRPDDGPWGMGAKQVTALAYDDSVWVVLDGLDGAEAHLAELVAAKIWVPVVVPVASDFTIDYANVPWVFRCFPSDQRQAAALVRYAKGRGYGRLLVFTEADREGRTGLLRLRDMAGRSRFPLARTLEFNPQVPEAVLDSVKLSSADAVLVWGRPDSGLRLLLEIRRAGFEGPVLVPACILSPELSAQGSGLGELVLAAPYDLSRTDEALGALRRRYIAKTGQPPDPVALFAYDAANLVISAIQRAGLNRARIRDTLAEQAYEGVVGTIRFGGLRGTDTEPVLMRLEGGTWVRLDSRAD